MTMKRLTVRSRAVIGTTAICLATVLRLPAQTTAPATGAAAENQETLVLSPFVVEAGEDTGYAARDTLAGTRIRTELKDVGSAIQVVTQKFLQDTNSKNAADLLVYTTGTEVAGQGGNFTGAGDGAVLDTTAYTQPNPNTRVRGLAAADNLRDFFLTDIPWDSYNVGRVDLQRGANSVLFGIGSPAGVINSSVNSASFKDANKVEFQFGSFGTHRQTVDINKVLIKDTLSVRVAALNDATNYRQDPAFRDDERIFGAVRWDPKLFSENARTSIRANYEKGEVNANYPRLTPPMDSITPWFSTMNKATFAYQNSNDLTTFGNAAYNPYLGAAGNRIWDGLVAVFEANDPTQKGMFVAQPSNYPATSDTNLNNTVNGSYKGIQAYNSFANNSRLPGYLIQPFKAKSLTDASIFDFYNNLIEGDNKRNWNEFDAFNVAISQTFLNDRIGFELTYDDQNSRWGYTNAISGDAAAITVDVMSTLADGSPNPNVGRPMVIMGGGSAGSGLTERDRETFRATAFGKFDFADVLAPDSTLTKILGSHNFTVAYTDYEEVTQARSRTNWILSSGYGPSASQSVGQATRDITPVIYLGGDLRGAGSSSDLNLPRITAPIMAASGTVAQWDTTIPGFRSYNVPVMDTNDLAGPFTQASNRRQTIESQVAVWQGSLFGGNLVPMAGWRKDIATAFDAGSPNKVDGLVSADENWRLPTSESDATNGRSWNRVEGQTRTWSVVLHVPRNLMERLPGKMGFSVYYNESENFQPDASRKDILGDSIAAPVGNTKDYGFTITALEGKLALKVNRYETSVTNATLSGELGNSYLIGAGEAWGQVQAVQLRDRTHSENYGTTTSGDILNWQPAAELRIADSMGRLPGDADYADTWSQGTIDAQYAAQQASVADWFAHQVPDKMQQAWGMTGYAQGSGSWSMNSVAVTGDTLSKGTEFELIASNVLVKGLDISLNASRTDAKRLNLAKAYSDWIEQRWEDYQGPMGDMRMWGGGNWALQQGSGGTVRDKFEVEVMGNYKLALALNNSSVAELRPWRFNVVANYTFPGDSRFKGANVGTSYRWQDKQVVGFKLNSTLDGYDVDQRYYGPSEDAFDFWVGYSRPVFRDRIQWRVQANVRNAFASKKLIPVTVQPDGSPGAYRIPEPTIWTLTNTFSF